MSKHYIAVIEETNGSFEYKSEFLFTTDEDPWVYGKEVAADWRSGNTEYDSNVGGFWNEDTIICLDAVKEIPADDFEVLSKYLSVH